MTTIGKPKIDTRPEQIYMGIRTITPFKGMSKVIDRLSKELDAWVNEHQVETTGPPFLRLHVIDMRGFMDISFGIPVHQALPDDGNIQAGVLAAGRYASLIYSGGGIAGNRALIEWVRANGMDFDRWDTEQGDNFRSRFESFLTDPRLEPRKSRWEIEVAIKLADVSPLIPGLNFRHFQGDRDYAQLAAVLTASEAVDHLERQVSAENIANAYQHLNNCDPFKDIIVAEVYGKIVGYARGWWENVANSERLYHHNGFLVPEWRRKGIGHAMLLWTENRLREIADSLEGSTRYFQVNTTQFQKGTAVMLERAGYEPVHYFYEMVRPSLKDIMEFPLPDGLEIRPVSPEHYPALWKSIDETSKDEWGYSEPADKDYQDWLTSPHFQPHLWQVAWEIATNQIVGHVLTFIDAEENEQRHRNRGYTEGIGVERAWRRRGVARALISRSLQAQKAAGMTESALAADSDSTSNVIQLYESCGFQTVKRDTIYRKPF